MSTQALSALVATIVGCAIGGSVFLREARRSVHVIFASFAFNVALYYLFAFLSRGLGSDLFDWVSMIVAVSLPATAQRFFRSFLGDNVAPPPYSKSAIGAAIIGYVALLLSRFVEPWHTQQWFRIAFAAYVLGGLYLSVYFIFRRFRAAPSRVEKIRLRYLLIGGLFAVTAVALEAIIEGLTIGTVLTIIYLYFLSQTLVRYRLLDLNELLGRMAVLGSLVFIVTIIYALLVMWVPAEQQGLFFFNALLASTAILIVLDPLRARVEGSINRWMFQEKYELTRRLENLRSDLLNIIDARAITPRVLAALEDSRRVTHAALYFVDPDGSGYELSGHIGPKPEARIDAIAHRALLDRLKDRTILTLEGLEQELTHLRAVSGRQRQGEEQETIGLIIRTLELMNASVALAIVGEDQLLGLLVLRDERLREAYASDELELFRGVAASMGVTLQNSQVYERMKERERLAALGQMAAGLAHEIRNPLGSIKGAAQYLLPSAEGDAMPLPSREFLDIIVEEVDRLNKTVSQFLDYARPYRGEQSPLDISQVLRKTLALLEREEGAAHIEITTNLADLPPVRADAEQLRQVFLNLAINAIQALQSTSTEDTPGRLHISTSLRRATRRGAVAGFLEIRFRDNGPGIAPEVIKDMFVPFFTTKDQGTGLGLPISQRIIENHGGTIEVRSRPGLGATFTVLLPVEADAFASYVEKHKGPPPMPPQTTPLPIPLGDESQEMILPEPFGRNRRI